MSGPLLPKPLTLVLFCRALETCLPINVNAIAQRAADLTVLLSSVKLLTIEEVLFGLPPNCIAEIEKILPPTPTT